MNSFRPTVPVPFCCNAHTQTRWGISNRRYLRSFTPALTSNRVGLETPPVHAALSLRLRTTI
jgi:hypothetical protein